MTFTETGFKGLWEIVPRVHRDDRGYFFEHSREDQFEKNGIPGSFVQDNKSFSRGGVLRGLHFQRAPHQQGKLVSVCYGKVLDVVVDLRPGSDTIGRHYKCILDDRSRKMLYIPEGFAHGFLALEDTFFTYKCTQYYNRESEWGICWDDKDLAIDWGQNTPPQLSMKDNELPTYQQVMDKLTSVEPK